MSTALPDHEAPDIPNAHPPKRLPAEARQRLFDAVQRLGVRTVSKRLGIAPDTVLRLIHPDLDARPGSVSLAEAGIPRLSAALPGPALQRFKTPGGANRTGLRESSHDWK